MSSQIKTIVRILRSAGSVTLSNGQTSLLNLDDTRLIENIYDGENLEDQRSVAEGVRPASSSVYVVSDSNTFILYVDTGNLLKASEFDPDLEGWREEELQGLGRVAIHPKGQLATAALHEVTLVFYQETDGVVKSVLYDQTAKIWSEGFPVPGDAQAGTPISAFSTDKALVVSFIGRDGSVHVHSRDLDSGDWTDTTLNSSSWNEPVTSLIVSQDSETGELEAFALVNTTVDHVKKDGTRSAVGSFVGDDFVPATKAEAGDMYNYGTNYGPINNYWGGGYGGCGGYCPPPRPCPPCRPYWCC